jgi:outer membrane lipoprotein-sorting protein
MWIRSWVLMAVAAAAVPTGSVCQTDEQRGHEIAERADRLTRGYGDLTARLTMVLRDRKGRERRREMRIQVLETEGDREWTLLVFDNPRDLRGTALLTHGNPSGDDDQWLYLPALKRVKRIVSSGGSGSFMGSEFSYEDIRSQAIDRHRYRLAGEELLEGNDCWIVERVPRDLESTYSRQLIWIDRSEHRVRRLDYYDRSEQLLKTLLLKGFRRHLDRFWRPDEMEMVNHQTGRSTRILWHEYEFGVGLDQRDFDRASLERVG